MMSRTRRRLGQIHNFSDAFKMDPRCQKWLRGFLYSGSQQYQLIFRAFPLHRQQMNHAFLKG